MREKHLAIMGTIDAEQAKNIIKTIEMDVSNDCSRIHLVIQSPGGSVPISLALAELIRSLPCPVTTYNIGSIDSAAVIVFAAGSQRICSPGASFCTHPIGKHIEGIQTIDSLRSIAKEIENDTKRVIQYLSRQSKGSNPETWRKLMSKRNIISPRKAVRLGLVHRIEEYSLK